ncbi:MAG TPA: TIGR00730 family Rossman fold protein [Candidatus Binatia bacterium]
MENIEQQSRTLVDLVAQIDEWLATQDRSGNADQVAGIMRTVVKLTQDDAGRGDLKILNRALQELRHAFRVFAPYRHVRKVSIFGSTRVQESDPYYDLARSVAQGLAQAGLMVITGAGPGIMQAGHEGAGRDMSFGVNIRLPSAQAANPFILNDPKLMNFHFFFTRKLMFVKEADAVVIFPGGFGTHDELLESITLAQTGKSQLVPIILMDLPEGTYWSRWQDFLRNEVMSRGYIAEREMNVFKICTRADAAVKDIASFYRNFHSYRFVKQDLVIRLNHPPAPALIDRLNRDFSDILTDGKIRQTEPLADETDDPDTLHLHRLLVRFNREDFVRLRQMIDEINGVA